MPRTQIDYAIKRNLVPENQGAEITVLGNYDPLLGKRHFQNGTVGKPEKALLFYIKNIYSFRAQEFHQFPVDIFIGQKP